MRLWTIHKTTMHIIIFIFDNIETKPFQITTIIHANSIFTSLQF